LCHRDAAEAEVDLDSGLVVSDTGLFPDCQDFPAAATEGEKGHPAAPTVYQFLNRQAAARGLATGMETAWGTARVMALRSVMVTGMAQGRPGRHIQPEPLSQPKGR